MAVESTSKILEGVFAIHKPPHLSSAQVLRDLQSHFNPSKLFGPLLESERRKRADLDWEGKRRRRQNPNEGQVKLGHGGTLDPLATGVLIVGVGKGTRELASFLGCKKTYDTVVLFGKSTDTYDTGGKIVASAPYEHVTKELVEEKLSGFRGKIQQAPPIYSAIKVNGMKAYDYARSGKELPKELAPRDMEVAECKILEWHAGGTHEYRWPAEEAPEDEKEAARKLLIQDTKLSAEQGQPPESRKRKTSPVEEQQVTELDVKRPKTECNNDRRDVPSEPLSHASESIHASPSSSSSTPPKSTTATTHIHAPPPSSTTPSPAPACTISLTVSSGFYVRSFAHDLGLACNSLGIMASLVRSRQGAFALPDPTITTTSVSTSTSNPLTATSSSSSSSSSSYGVLSYADLARGEDHWGPIVAGMLQQWNAHHQTPGSDDNVSQPRLDDRDRYPRNRDGDRRDRGRHHNNVKGFSAKRGFGAGSSGPGSGQRRDRDQSYHGGERRRERRNTSSGEE